MNGYSMRKQEAVITVIVKMFGCKIHHLPQYSYRALISGSRVATCGDCFPNIAEFACGSEYPPTNDYRPVPPEQMPGVTALSQRDCWVDNLPLVLPLNPTLTHARRIWFISLHFAYQEKNFWIFFITHDSSQATCAFLLRVSAQSAHATRNSNSCSYVFLRSDPTLNADSKLRATTEWKQSVQTD